SRGGGSGRWPRDHRCPVSGPANNQRGRHQQPEVLTRESREWTRMKEIVFKDESYGIIGACFEVYNEKGCGFLEPVYQECLQIEFEYQRIPAIAKPALTLSYRGRALLQAYQADFVCYGKIIVELKAVSALVDEHR